MGKAQVQPYQRYITERAPNSVKQDTHLLPKPFAQTYGIQGIPINDLLRYRFYDNTNFPRYQFPVVNRSFPTMNAAYAQGNKEVEEYPAHLIESSISPLDEYIGDYNVIEKIAKIMNMDIIASLVGGGCQSIIEIKENCERKEVSEEPKKDLSPPKEPKRQSKSVEKPPSRRVPLCNITSVSYTHLTLPTIYSV
eukprot:TRINITY_DN11379_c0_g2_i1.p1 TRINITY_DN11379_c0_g2~~TRINITY_DN11379_c0_g2_i1.p1  ORF type:complete len:225 (-),score=52.01 TRINITY_DN11379_c0_g2_i1:32-613(-)